jgi:hypothetical protein
LSGFYEVLKAESANVHVNGIPMLVIESVEVWDDQVLLDEHQAFHGGKFELREFPAENLKRKQCNQTKWEAELGEANLECSLQKLGYGGALLRLHVLPVAGTVPVAKGHSDFLIFLPLLHFQPFAADPLPFTEIHPMN